MALITCESIVLSLLLFARSCASQSTAMTTYTSSNFIGYYISPDGQAETLNAGNAWTTSGTFAGDCDSDSSTCSLATACLSETLYFNNEEKLSCTGGLSCVTFTIFQTSPNGWPSATNYGCRLAWSANTVYKELATTTAVSTGSTLILGSASTEATPTSTTTTSTVVSSSPTSTNSSDGSISSNDSSSSKAWIVGAVLGPVAALTIVAVALYFIRKHRRTALGQAGAQDTNQGMRYLDHHGYAKPELDATMTTSHQYVPAELDASIHHSARTSTIARSPVELS